jgi:hypothetical protein
MEATMNGTRELLDQINRRTDAVLRRLGASAADVTEGTADGRFTLPGLIAVMAVGASDRPRQSLVAEAITPATIERALDEIGRLRGVPIRASEVREVIHLLTTGEVIVDVATGIRAALLLVPRLPVALTRDALALPDLPREVAEAIRADLKDNAPRTLRDVIVDLHDGELDDRRRILTHTLRVLLGRAAPGVLVETIHALIGPENQTLRLAVLVYARTQGVDLDEKDLDALFRALNPDDPDLGVFLDRGLERVTSVAGDASRAVALLRRISAPRPGAELGAVID